jgi:hypothetical protein
MASQSFPEIVKAEREAIGRAIQLTDKLAMDKKITEDEEKILKHAILLAYNWVQHGFLCEELLDVMFIASRILHEKLLSIDEYCLIIEKLRLLYNAAKRVEVR